MGQFSAKERLIASMLSAFPGVKKKVKTVYSYLGYYLSKKNYKERVNAEAVLKGLAQKAARLSLVTTISALRTGRGW